MAARASSERAILVLTFLFCFGMNKKKASPTEKRDALFAAMASPYQMSTHRRNTG
jgi:hypothetical protein